MSEITEQHLNDHRSDLQKVKDRAKALERLNLNPDFKTIVIDGFLKEDAARFVQLSVDLELTDEQRKDALGTAQASGYFKKYLHYIGLMGRQADSQIDQVDRELETIRIESGV